MLSMVRPAEKNLLALMAPTGLNTLETISALSLSKNTCLKISFIGKQPLSTYFHSQ